MLNHYMLKMAENGVLRRIDTTYGIKVRVILRTKEKFQHFDQDQSRSD